MGPRHVADGACAGRALALSPAATTFWIVVGKRYWGKDRVDWLAARVRELGA